MHVSMHACIHCFPLISDFLLMSKSCFLATQKYNSEGKKKKQKLSDNFGLLHVILFVLFFSSSSVIFLSFQFKKFTSVLAKLPGKFRGSEKNNFIYNAMLCHP